MSDHEEELRRHLQDPRWDLPVADDAEGRIRRAARRAHRVRLASSLALLLVLGTAAGGYGLTRQSKALHVITPAGSPSAATGSPAPSPQASPKVSPSPAQGGDAQTAAGIPGGFQAASVSFVSANDGWVLGASCPTCTVAILHTTDGGATWAAIPGPAASLAEASDATTGVSTIRFANANDGWAFGPELWSTHDGGATWSRPSGAGINADGTFVMGVEASNGMATAAILDVGSSGAGIRIETTPVATDSWLRSATSVEMGAGPVAETQIALHGVSGWIVENDRIVVGGARLVGGIWKPWTPPCSSTGGPATVAASSATNVVALCDEGVWTGNTVGEYLYGSTDGGTTFTQRGTKVPFNDLQSFALAPGTPTLVASRSTGSGDLVASFDGGSTWSTVLRGPTGGGEFKELGFTTANQGVAIEAVGGPLGSLLMTHDGGHSWAPVAFSSGAASQPRVKASPSPQPSPTLPVSGPPAIGSPGWPASLYAPPVSATAGTALSACPGTSGLQAFTPSSQSAATAIAKGYGQTSELDDFEHTDPSLWSRLLQTWGSGHQAASSVTVVQSGPASQSSYASMVTAACGMALAQESYAVTIAPQLSPGANACVACQSQLFFVDRSGTPLVYFSY